ncbi:hypothetical protein [Mixta mediterraneensis]|uniref:hypothetical protein n=1 Tax=Mixta mediterraneensis TaxID=2758443 RepID=UPI001874FE4C|nr:hypothetical protein [Mixta mediterraneensis]
MTIGSQPIATLRNAAFQIVSRKIAHTFFGAGTAMFQQNKPNVWAMFNKAGFRAGCETI